jgi:hypothetical protein
MAVDDRSTGREEAGIRPIGLAVAHGIVRPVRATLYGQSGQDARAPGALCYQ